MHPPLALQVPGVRASHPPRRTIAAAERAVVAALITRGVCIAVSRRTVALCAPGRIGVRVRSGQLSTTGFVRTTTSALRARLVVSKRAANTAITVANGADTRVHAYLAKGDVKYEPQNTSEFARVATETGGQSYTYQDTLDSGFQAMLEGVICASKAPAEPVEDCGLP